MHTVITKIFQDDDGGLKTNESLNRWLHWSDNFLKKQNTQIRTTCEHVIFRAILFLLFY